jgi:hypothetical protein
MIRELLRIVSMDFDFCRPEILADNPGSPG